MSTKSSALCYVELIKHFARTVDPGVACHTSFLAFQPEVKHIILGIVGKNMNIRPSACSMPHSSLEQLGYIGIAFLQ